MVLSQKSKCAGCKALINKGNHYECSLAFKVTFEGEGKEIYAPKPQEKCYKPRTEDEMTNAKQRKEKLDNREQYA